jgi:hypothetical protein
VSVKKELDSQIKKHAKKMSEVFKNLRLLLKEKEFKEYHNLALSYLSENLILF